MARNMNRLTRSNLLAHVEACINVEDVATLYGAAGDKLAASLEASGLIARASRNGSPVFHLTHAGRAALSA